MDEQHGQGTISDSAAQLRDKVGELAAQTQKAAQDRIEQSKPVLHDLQASAGEAMDKATDLARQASRAGVETVTEVSGMARDVASQAYQQGTRAGGYVSEFVREQPLAALLIAGAVGYGIAYLIHQR
jgi:ElaB/YqjD/DUF883 family membrane-anchored ribosome-binding protein